MRTALRLGFVGSLFLLATGFTDCQYFSTVTVPTTDRAVPSPFNAIYKNAELVDARVGDTPLHFDAQPGEIMLVVAGGIDRGGVKQVTLTGSQSSYCCYSNGTCSQTQSVSTPIVETQAGTIGGTVSNGVWAATPVTVGGCSAASTSGHWSFSWSVKVEDFHGNVAYGPASSVSWTLE